MFIFLILTIISSNCKAAAAAAGSKEEAEFHTQPQQIAVEDFVKGINPEDGILAINSYRSRHGIPPVDYDMVLGQNAASWAKKLHDKLVLLSQLRPLYSHPHIEGENVYVSQGEEGGVAAVNKWYSEIKDYNFTYNQFTFPTAQFTQLVWKRTRRVGMSIAYDPIRNFTVIVARFKPPGNVGFKLSFKENIFPLLKQFKNDSKLLYPFSQNTTLSVPSSNLIQGKPGNATASSQSAPQKPTNVSDSVKQTQPQSTPNKDKPTPNESTIIKPENITMLPILPMKPVEELIPVVSEPQSPKPISTENENGNNGNGGKGGSPQIKRQVTDAPPITLVTPPPSKNALKSLDNPNGEEPAELLSNIIKKYNQENQPVVPVTSSPAIIVPVTPIPVVQSIVHHVPGGRSMGMRKKNDTNLENGLQKNSSVKSSDISQSKVTTEVILATTTTSPVNISSSTSTTSSTTEVLLKLNDGETTTSTDVSRRNDESGSGSSEDQNFEVEDISTSASTEMQIEEELSPVAENSQPRSKLLLDFDIPTTSESPNEEVTVEETVPVLNSRKKNLQDFPKKVKVGKGSSETIYMHSLNESPFAKGPLEQVETFKPRKKIEPPTQVPKKSKSQSLGRSIQQKSSKSRNYQDEGGRQIIFPMKNDADGLPQRTSMVKVGKGSNEVLAAHSLDDSPYAKGHLEVQELIHKYKYNRPSSGERFQTRNGKRFAASQRSRN